MTVVLPETKYPCIDDDAAIAFAAYLTVVEELDGIVTAGRIVTVPGMDLRGAMEIAELGVTLEHMSDTAAAGVIAAIEANPDKRWAG